MNKTCEKTDASAPGRPTGSGPCSNTKKIYEKDLREICPYIGCVRSWLVGRGEGACPNTKEGQQKMYERDLKENRPNRRFPLLESLGGGRGFVLTRSRANRK